MQILIPIANDAKSFFPVEDYHFPKPLIEVSGKPMIERVIENFNTVKGDKKFFFVTNKNDNLKFSLGKIIDLLAPGSKNVVLRDSCSGSICSCLMTIDLIDADKPLIIGNGDQEIEDNINDIIEKFVDLNADAGVLTFESVHPRWSYVRCDHRMKVSEAAEKRVISRHAIAGFYYFARAKIFFEAAKRAILGGASLNGEFFISSALNEIILDELSVFHLPIPADRYHSFYSPSKIKAYEALAAHPVKKQPKGAIVDLRVMIPAAGEGSRFRNAGYLKPKPFIDVFGRPMIEHVLGNVCPSGAKAHLLLRREHRNQEITMVRTLEANGVIIHDVEGLTEGTACTLLTCRNVFDDDHPLLVANSDQFVEFDVSAFVQDCFDRGLDGSILVFKDPTRDKKWSFVRVDPEGNVQEVAEKQPISDLATVGIYLFRKGSAFVDAAVDMIAKNDRVNGEFYTCPVYNYMIAAGLKIGVYEISAIAMHGLGTPSDLESFLARGLHVDISAKKETTE